MHRRSPRRLIYPVAVCLNSRKTLSIFSNITIIRSGVSFLAKQLNIFFVNFAEKVEYTIKRKRKRGYKLSSAEEKYQLKAKVQSKKKDAMVLEGLAHMRHTHTDTVFMALLF